MNATPTKSSSRLVKSPWCIYEQHCGKRAILMPEIPWPTGAGSQQDCFCIHCPSRGVISRAVRGEKAKQTVTDTNEIVGIAIPDWQAKRGRA